MFGRPQSGDPNLQQSIRYLEDQLRRGGSSGVSGNIVRIPDVSLVAGNNTVYHGLGRKPVTWWTAAPEGAFPTSGAGGGASIYPNITPPQASASQASASSYTATYTMQFTPVVGATLVALAVFENASLTGMSFSQTGVTWTKVAGPVSHGSSDSSELWVGSVDSAPSTSVAVTYTGGGTGAVGSLTVVEIPEITSTTPTASDSYAFPSVSFPGVRPYDTTQQCTTPPVPNAGDIVITAVNCASAYAPMSAGWDCVAANLTVGTAYDDVAIFAKVAQEAEHQPFRALPHTYAQDIAVFQACFPTNLTALSAGAVTVPHGFREVASDASTLTINSIGACTVDIMVQ